MEKLKNVKFLLGTLLVIMFSTLCFALSTNVYAAETALPEADDAGVITLTDDVEISSSIEITENTTIKLNGYTITNNSTSGRLFNVTQAVNFTIDGTTSGSKIVSSSQGILTVSAAATVTLNGGTYTNNNVDKMIQITTSASNSKITLTNLTATANGYIVYMSYNSNSGVSLNVTGGTYTVTKAGYETFRFGGANGNNKAIFTNVTGTTVNKQVLVLDTSDAEINNCNFTVEQTNSTSYEASAVATMFGGDIVINGGTYTSAGFGLYVWSSGGTITLNSGTVNAPTAIRVDADYNHDEWSGSAIVSVSDGTITGNVVNSNGNLNISGGTYITGDPSAYLTENVIAVTVSSKDGYTYVGTVSEINEKINSLASSGDTVTVTGIGSSVTAVSLTGLEGVTVKDSTSNVGKVTVNGKEVTEEGTTVTHELTHVEKVEATEDTDGNIEYWYCEICGKYFSDEGTTEITKEETVIKATGHNLTYVEKVEATEDTDGNIEYWYCEGCGKYFSDEGTTEITKEETIIKATGHSLTHVERVEATEDTDGNIEYWYCEGCGKYFSDEGTTEITKEEIVIKATGHNVIYVEGFEATITSEGLKEHWECLICGKLFTDEELTQEVEWDDLVIDMLPSSIQTLVDETSKIEVTTNVGENAKLIIEEVEVEDALLEEFNKMENLEEYEIIGSYEVTIEGDYTGEIKITFNVGTENDGKLALIFHKRADGLIEEYERTVADGKVTITVSELSPFVIAVAKTEETTDDETDEVIEDTTEETVVEETTTETVTENPQTGDEIMLFVVAFMVSILGVAITTKKIRKI